jgi:hypothetical protein
MTTTLNNYKELREFIDANYNNIPSSVISEILKRTMKVYSLFEFESKEALLEQMDYFQNKFGHLEPKEKPLFLFQRELEFSVKDIYN